MIPLVGLIGANVVSGLVYKELRKDKSTLQRVGLGLITGPSALVVEHLSDD